MNDSLSRLPTCYDTSGKGESSDDECCLCGRLWNPSCTGWPLCDTPNCPNVCCSTCSEALIVSELFYCPPCAGSGTSAAAAVGGSVVTSIKMCNELTPLPLSQKAIKAILRNLIKKPDDPKYRKLRLNNPKVKSLLDLDPCRRLLSLVGFTTQTDEINNTHEPVLVLEGAVNVEDVQKLLEILEGTSSQEVKDLDEKKVDGEEENSTSSIPKKRPPPPNTDTQENQRKEKRKLVTDEKIENSNGSSCAPETKRQKNDE